MTNGVDVEALKETVGQIQNDPALGKSRFRVTNKWDKGGHNTCSIGGYFAAGQERKHNKEFNLEADEPKELLGTDTCANPVEYLLTALSSCMTTTIAYHAAAKGIEIESMWSDFQGELDLQGFLNLDPSVPKGYQMIDATFHVKTAANVDLLEDLYQFSPVYSMVSQSVPINVTFVKE